MSRGGPRHEFFVYALGILAVGAIWFTFNWSRGAGRSDLDRWETEPLTVEEITDRLGRNDLESLGHALIQMVVRFKNHDDERPALSGLMTKVALHAGHESGRVRRLVAWTAGNVHSDDAPPIMKDLLEDELAAVRLTAAMGLANYDDPAGADVMAEAIEGTRPEEKRTRRNLLELFRFVASENHRKLLEGQLEIARLDGDDESAAFCRDALTRIEGAK